MGIHFARYENSPRLQRIIRLLLGGGWFGTWDITINARVAAASEAICELRRNGFEIEKRQLGRGKFEYRLISVPCEQTVII